FDDYLARHEAGEPRAVAVMVDFWFGAGGFELMPAAAQEHLARAAPRNVLDVRSTFEEAYSPEALGALAVPLLAVHGTASPPITARIAAALAGRAGAGALAAIDGATHALTSTHAERVAELIAAHAERCAPRAG